ncbi:hypothetical protein [Actinomadura sp. WAC 06369]|uniref:hypothetical protein n=1 Tax=Actinomadura sp. WAC 06369 TaxID=2203193 RepID=UPI000F784BC7|nr:hypothetical protein [Actinomadura sp. WAC 06369]RSN51327.1 hypothetical protein DMH08_30830 [Actinomadura sp. WAC 06369]
MTGPCRECPRRETDFGGCRRRAHALTGDAARTDPARALSPAHGLVQDAAAAAGGPGPPFVHRRPSALRWPGRRAVTPSPRRGTS